MADITWTDVTNHAPGLSSVSAGAQTDILAWSNDLLSVDEFGGEAAANTKLARIYLAAHSGTLALLGASGAAGPVTSEKAGGLSRSYGGALGAAASSDYGSTVWGQQFVALCRTNPSRAGLVL